jgi:phosphoenolpyruvate carboxykinase (GTP)
MVILGIENPAGEIHYVAAAFPSGCGKTNLAMLIPPEALRGHKIWTLGDDIAWLHVGEDGRLWAINPEAGFFGIVHGTNEHTNFTASRMIKKNTIFTNVAVTKDGMPWWEGLSETPPDELIDWQGDVYDPKTSKHAAHPNSRFTVSCKQCASYSPKAEDPKGVPISAIIFGGRRKELTPLVMEAKSWTHGVLIGATAASETTAAATMQVGTVRRDPMAMKPFCGYNFGDYWAHWLKFTEKTSKLPKIFHVNWFIKDENGKFLWPGFSDNLRVLMWILKRCDGGIDAVDTPIGYLPKEEDLNLEGLNVSSETMSKLLSFDKTLWEKEYEEIEEFFATFGKRMPQELLNERKKLYDELVDVKLKNVS